jgi:hypothetical protein
VSDLFVDSSGTTTTISAPMLGHVERTCAHCGREWLMTQGECRCGSHELTERYVEPTPILSGLASLVTSKPQRAPRATAALVSGVRGLVATIEHLRAELAQWDGQVAAGVAGGVEELQPAHNVLHAATFATGDASMEHVRLADLVLRSLSVYLELATENLGKENP